VRVAVPIEGPNDAAGDDLALVRAARLDPAAFGALYDRYYVRVYRYLRARAASDDDAADLTQQAFLKALDALPAYRERGLPFAAWLFRIARNAAIDHHRRQRPTTDLAACSALLPAGDDPEGSIIHGERLQRLRQLVDGLEPDKRELLALRFAGGLSSREIAEVVGKSEAAVKRQLTRIIALLREQYGEP
jgi:RNA polymerase sigma-70 factor, ECF subfamily